MLEKSSHTVESLASYQGTAKLFLEEDEEFITMHQQLSTMNPKLAILRGHLAESSFTHRRIPKRVIRSNQ